MPRGSHWGLPETLTGSPVERTLHIHMLTFPFSLFLSGEVLHLRNSLCTVIILDSHDQSVSALCKKFRRKTGLH